MNKINAENLTFKELRTLYELMLCKSVHACARRLSYQPARVSKMLAKIEKNLGSRMFDRSIQGLHITPEGARFQEMLPTILRVIDEIKNPGSSDPAHKEFNIGGVSFLNSYLLAATLARLVDEYAGAVFRNFDATNEQIIALVQRGQVDLAIHIGEIDWPGSWVSKKIGSIQWILVAGKNSPLPNTVDQTALADIDFVTPLLFSVDGLKNGSDMCPLSKSERKVPFQVTTAETALSLVTTGLCVAFLPKIILTPHNKLRLREIRVRQWPSVTRDVYISAHSHRVPNKLFLKLVDSLQKKLSVK